VTYDIVIVGAGGVGCAAAFHAAKRGLRVLALDRFPPAHDRGSSHGQTRIIRQAYFEHPDYVPLLFRAYELWRELEQVTGESLLQINGLIQIGPPQGEVIPGVLESARRWKLDIASLSESDLAARYPQFHLPENWQALYEAQAGVLHVEKCVQAHALAAQQIGAEFRDGVAVKSWQPDGQGVRILTDRGDFLAARAVLTPGAWASDLLAPIANSLRVLRKHLHWFPVNRSDWKCSAPCPSFLYELPHGVFYGIPAIDDQGVKIGEHTGGAVVTDPLDDDRSIELEDQRRVQQFVAQELRGLAKSPTIHRTCFYTMSPDQHFIVGLHPDSENVAFACGLSGHGFKFTGALGEALVALGMGESATVSVDFLSPMRFSRSQA
jgi:sarcosine oxidase